eukprot:s2794_g8.t1
MARDAFQSYEQNCTDIAVLEGAFEGIGRDVEALQYHLGVMQGEVQAAQNEMNATQGNFRRVREAHNELQGEMETLSDMQDQLHYGLVQLGGSTPFRDLTPDQRQHMFTLERGNMMAARTGACKWCDSSIKESHVAMIQTCLDKRILRVKLEHQMLSWLNQYPTTPRLGDKVERMANSVRGNLPAIAERWQIYADQLRQMAFED